jgi:RimJ/RimL family protein N-acetyltransferase
MTASSLSQTLAAGIPVVKSARLTLRGAEPRDIEPMVAFYASDRSGFVGGPLDRDGAWRQLACEIGHWTLNGFGRWMVENTETGETVGMVGLWYPPGLPEREIGWDLFEGFGGKGYATEAAQAARCYAYDVLGWTTAISLVDPDNFASARVAERVGARRDGKFEHPRFGTLHIYRHPAPEALRSGGTDAP